MFSRTVSTPPPKYRKKVIHASSSLPKTVRIATQKPTQRIVLPQENDLVLLNLRERYKILTLRILEQEHQLSVDRQLKIILLKEIEERYVCGILEIFLYLPNGFILFFSSEQRCPCFNVRSSQYDKHKLY